MGLFTLIQPSVSLLRWKACKLAYLNLIIWSKVTSLRTTGLGSWRRFSSSPEAFFSSLLLQGAASPFHCKIVQNKKISFRYWKECFMFNFSSLGDFFIFLLLNCLYQKVTIGGQTFPGRCCPRTKLASFVCLFFALSGSTSAVTGARIGTTVGAWAFCKARPTTSMNTCVLSVSRRRMQWRFLHRSLTRITRACAELYVPYR